MRYLSLEVISHKGIKRIGLGVRRLLLAGYSGRDQEVVRRHVEELKRLGVPTPNKVPALYEVSPSLLTVENLVKVRNQSTSGEVEYVLIVASKSEIYVTVGSDHTDREMERVDVLKAKEACPKIIAPRVWPYEEVLDHWDELILRSITKVGSHRIVYQEGTLSLLLRPETLLEVFNARRDGTILFSGTIPAREGLSLHTDFFEMHLIDPRLNREIHHSYEVIVEEQK